MGEGLEEEQRLPRVLCDDLPTTAAVVAQGLW